MDTRRTNGHRSTEACYRSKLSIAGRTYNGQQHWRGVIELNVERLHLILRAALDSVTASGLIPEIGALATSLQNQVNDPATSIYQQQVGTQLVKLRDVLSAMETNNFPPGWKQVLTEHELWYFIGNDLLRV